MQFLKTMLWVIIAVVTVLFSINNWTPVTLNLWAGLQMETQLPILVIAAFLLGLIPYFVLHRATRWSLNRKLSNAERSLAEYRGLGTIQPSESNVTNTASTPPITVPPGVL